MTYNAFFFGFTSLWLGVTLAGGSWGTVAMAGFIACLAGGQPPGLLRAIQAACVSGWFWCLVALATKSSTAGIWWCVLASIVLALGLVKTYKEAKA